MRRTAPCSREFGVGQREQMGKALGRQANNSKSHDGPPVF